MTNNNTELYLPSDRTLPFFVYGTFKPGQIAYSRIEQFVEKPTIRMSIPYLLYLRDGTPFISHETTERPYTRGYLLEFKSDKDAIDAYNIIGEVVSNRLYKWGETNVSGKNVNVLFGRKPSRSRPKELGGSFDGSIDPYFNEAIKLIYSEIRDKKSILDVEDYFKIQRNYILLWAAIERYTSLRYGFGNITDNNKKLANEKIFQDSLRCVIGKKTRKIYRTDNLNPHKLNADDPEDSIKYYYTIRCNIVHRGKRIDEKDEMLLDSLIELICIFQDVLDDTFK